MTKQVHSLLEAIKQKAFIIGIGGFVTFAVTFAVAASFRVPIKLTLIYTYDGRMILKVHPVNVCEPIPMIPDEQEKLIAQSADMVPRIR